MKTKDTLSKTAIKKKTYHFITVPTNFWHFLFGQGLKILYGCSLYEKVLSNLLIFSKFSEKGFCVPTVFLWLLFVYIEASIRLKEFKAHLDLKHLPFHLDLCRPFAAHCIGKTFWKNPRIIKRLDHVWNSLLYSSIFF